MKKVLGIGNALLDILVKLDTDEILTELSIPKGSMQLVDKDFSNTLVNKINKFITKRASGGSSANTIHGLACLGVETGYIGKVGDDEMGTYFLTELIAKSIVPILYKSSEETGRAIALISPDSERTFATFLGAAVDLKPDDIESDIFDDYDFLHIEGYLVQNKDMLIKATEIAQQKGLTISLDMASYNIVADNISFLKDLMTNYIDVIFANEEEARAFTGKNPMDALEELAQYCDIAVVKIGKKGSLVKKGNTTAVIGPHITKVIDTTGAGDLYAAGFIYGLLKNLPVYKCAEIGTLLATKVIEKIGAKIADEKWADIITIVERIVKIGTNKWQPDKDYSFA